MLTLTLAQLEPEPPRLPNAPAVEQFQQLQQLQANLAASILSPNPLLIRRRLLLLRYSRCCNCEPRGELQPLGTPEDTSTLADTFASTLTARGTRHNSESALLIVLLLLLILIILFFLRLRFNCHSLQLL